MSGSENGSPGAQEKPEGNAQSEHLNIKVTDNNNEVFFKIKRTTALKKLMDAFCERQGKAPNSVRFLFDGSRVQATDSPDSVSSSTTLRISKLFSHFDRKLTYSSSSIWPTVTRLKFTKNKSEAHTRLDEKQHLRNGSSSWKG